MVVKTFRGLLADGAQDRIRLQTIKGKIGYRIIKFQGIPKQPFTTDGEHVIKLYLNHQTSIDDAINFTDSDLLAVVTFANASSNTVNYSPTIIIFDKQIFNQDIYVTHTDARSTQVANYYLELEVIPLDDAGAEYTTLKDMRSG